jgi:uncharacterized repeat protein (TIGR01451 family)
MKLQKALWLPAVVAALSGVATTANAAGTTAGTTISNTASVDYAVGSAAQTTVDSNQVDFLVDLKVSFSLTRISTTTYASSNDGAAMTVAGYTITNTGNAPTSFAIHTPDGSQAAGTTVAVDSLYTPTANPVTDTINLPANTLTYWASADTTLDGADTNITANTLSAGVHTVSSLGNLVAEDGDLSIFVTMTDDGFTGIDKDIAAILSTVYGYQAEVSGALVDLDKSNQDPTDGTSTDDNGVADSASTVQIVYADTGANNTETVNDAVELVFPKIVVTKTSAVISDPINGASADAKAIPGAVVRYTLAAENVGRAAATSVVLTDAVPANTTSITDTVTFDDGTGAATQTDTADADATTVATGTVTVDLDSVAAGATETVTFDVTID